MWRWEKKKRRQFSTGKFNIETVVSQACFISIWVAAGEACRVMDSVSLAEQTDVHPWEELIRQDLLTTHTRAHRSRLALSHSHRDAHKHTDGRTDGRTDRLHFWAKSNDEKAIRSHESFNRQENIKKMQKPVPEPMQKLKSFEQFRVFPPPWPNLSPPPPSFYPACHH